MLYIVIKYSKKCRFFENGYCKKNPCNYLHPEEVCVSFSSYGQCSYGVNCKLRHPANICMRYLEGHCNLGTRCVYQHPVRFSPKKSNYSSPLSLPYPPVDYQDPPYPCQFGSSSHSPSVAPFSRYRSSSVSETHYLGTNHSPSQAQQGFR